MPAAIMGREHGPDCPCIGPAGTSKPFLLLPCCSPAHPSAMSGELPCWYKRCLVPIAGWHDGQCCGVARGQCHWAYGPGVGSRCTLYTESTRIAGCRLKPSRRVGARLSHGPDNTKPAVNFAAVLLAAYSCLHGVPVCLHQLARLSSSTALVIGRNMGW